MKLPRPVDHEDVLWLARILFYAMLVIFTAGVMGVALRVFLWMADFR